MKFKNPNNRTKIKLSATIMTTVALVAGILFGYSFIGLNSVNALNMTSPNNMTRSANMTGSNMTMSNASGSSAKMHLEEGIKALKSGDNQAAMTHLDAARAAMVPGEAMNHFEQGMKALQMVIRMEQLCI